MAFQTEICPKTNRPHLQGMAQFDKKIKLNTMRDFCKQNDIQHHCEFANGHSDACLAYCTKEETRAPNAEPVILGEHVPTEGLRANRQGAREDIDALKTMIDEGADWEDVLNAHFGTVSRMFVFAKNYYDMVANRKYQQEIKEKLTATSLRPWQSALKTKLLGAVNDREVIWCMDPNGNIGKSFMCRYLQVLHGAVIIHVMKKADMIHLISKYIRDSSMVIFDLTKTCEGGSDKVVYEVAEQLKNGQICSGKYDSNIYVFKPPHVVCMANFPPDTSALIADRWKIVDLSDTNRSFTADTF